MKLNDYIWGVTGRLAIIMLLMLIASVTIGQSHIRRKTRNDPENYLTAIGVIGNITQHPLRVFVVYKVDGIEKYGSLNLTDSVIITKAYIGPEKYMEFINSECIGRHVKLYLDKDTGGVISGAPLQSEIRDRKPPLC